MAVEKELKAEMYKRNPQGWMKHIDFILWDILVLQLAYILAYRIRHGRLWPFDNPNYRMLGIILAVADLLIAIIFNSMHNVIKRGYGKEFIESARHSLLVLAAMSLYMFSVQSGDVYSRITLYLTAVFHFIFGYVIRLFWKAFLKRANKKRSKASMVLIASERRIPEILKKASELDDFNYDGIILFDRNAAGETIQGVPVIANLSDAADYICREHVDEVFVFPTRIADIEYQGKGEDTLAVLISQFKEMAIPVHVRLPLNEYGGKNFLEKVGGYDVYTSTINYATPVQMAIKRLFDIIGGLIGSLGALVIILIVGPKIKRESPGPVLFKQTRIGLNGKQFKCYKIRSMYMDADERKKELMSQNRVADGMMFKMDFDPRIIGNRIVNGKQVTGIGEMLRSTSLDEFPQFFNVLKGDMSLVGTRPPTVDEWDKYKYHHRARLATKPGLTGMWQVSGRSRITDFEQIVKLDTAYINNWSLALDVKILFKTIKVVLNKEGAM